MARGSNDVIIGGFHSVISDHCIQIFLSGATLVPIGISIGPCCAMMNLLDQYNLSFTFNIQVIVNKRIERKLTRAAEELLSRRKIRHLNIIIYHPTPFAFFAISL